MNRSLPGNPVKAANDPGVNRGNSPKKAPPAKGRAKSHRSRPLKREEIFITFTIASLNVIQYGYTISSLYLLLIYTDHSETGLTTGTSLLYGQRLIRARCFSTDSREPS